MKRDIDSLVAREEVAEGSRKDKIQRRKKSQGLLCSHCGGAGMNGGGKKKKGQKKGQGIP